MSDAEYTDQSVLGSAGFSSVASHSLRGAYKGVGAHAGASPWEGVNALDALVSAYVNVSMLRQQIRPTERIHGAIVEAPKVNGNAIPARTKIEYTVRSTTIKGARALGDRVRLCVEAGAVATGCDVEVEEISGYADLRVNDSLCGSFQRQMQANGVLRRQGYVAAATDQGNVSYVVPALHAIIGIPVDDDSKNHTPGFTKAAGTRTAYERAVVSGRAMAMTGWEILTDNALYTEVKRDFEEDRKFQ
jgi:metal-dependent amidase/aminoacylase/carboxypeptidase family protein